MSWERGQWLVDHWGGSKLFAWPVGGGSVDLYFGQEAWLFKRNLLEVSEPQFTSSNVCWECAGTYSVAGWGYIRPPLVALTLKGKACGAFSPHL